MKKILCLMLALLMLLPMAVSCKKDDKAPEDSTAAEVSTAEAEQTSSLDTLESVDLGGKEINILSRKEFAYEIAKDESGGSWINELTFKRNSEVQSKYNVKLNVTLEGGLWADRVTYKTKITNAVQGGDGGHCDYDIITGAQNQFAEYVTEGLFSNLMNNEKINFDNQWWFDGFVDNVKFNNRLYFTVGDVGVSLLENMNIVAFNKKMCDENKIAYPYDAVRSGNWTLAALNEMAKGVTYADINNNDIADAADSYSIVGGGAMLRGLTSAFEINVTEFDANGIPELTICNDRSVDIVDSFQSFLSFGNQGNFRDDIDPQVIFGGERSLMQFTSPANLVTLRQKYSIDYGIVPYPKYDTDQKSYHTHIYETLTVFAIPINAASHDESGMILEALGAAGLDYVTPEYFENVIKTQNAQDTDSYEMIALARENITFNFGFVYSNAIGQPGSVFDGMKTGTYSLQNSYDIRKSRWETSLGNLVDNFLKIEEE